MSNIPVAIIGAGPYGLSVAAHLAARNIEHRIFGRPMQFWSKIAEAGEGRFLKSYCFGTNISTPNEGSSFVDYNSRLGLETFEPCSIRNFAEYGQWFQQRNVSWAEPTDVVQVSQHGDHFMITLANGERCSAGQVVLATGLAGFAHVPAALATLPNGLAIHTSNISSFSSFKGLNVAVIGAGQSALEAAALLHEAGAMPQLFVREDSISWHQRVMQNRNLWRRLRSPISGLGTGPKAWALTRFPGAVYQMPEALRTRFVNSHLPAEGAWWLRDRVENKFPVHLGASIVSSRDVNDLAALNFKRKGNGSGLELSFDRVVAGTGYIVDVDRISFLEPELRRSIQRIGKAPKLSANFESSVPGLRFVGPTSAMSFGPLFRFVVGAEYTATVVSGQLAKEVSAPMPVEKAVAA
jgi:lysine/ornithine N-monooxygenase